MATTERPPALASNLVQEIVSKGHGDFDGVKALVEQEPALVNAVWDWGGGDFESPLLSAAHTGQREIALYLLERGARINLPAAVMLGQLEIVKAILTAFPAAKDIPGAHGIPLIKHAEYGGEAAAAVLEYLKSLG